MSDTSGPVERPIPTYRKDLREPRTVPQGRVVAYLDDRAARNIGLPANALGGPHYAELHAATGTQHPFLFKVPQQGYLQAFLAHHGLAPCVVDQASPLTIGELELMSRRDISNGFIDIAGESGGSSSDAEGVSTRAKGVGDFEHGLALIKTVVIDRSATPVADALMLARRNVADESDEIALRAVETRLHASVNSDDGLAMTLGDALWNGIGRAGFTAKALAASLGFNRQTLVKWANGDASPSARRSGDLRVIERALGLPAETLVRRIKPRIRGLGRIPAKMFPHDIVGAQTPRQRARLSPMLPVDFADQSEPERRRLVMEALRRLEERTSDYNRARLNLQRQPYSLGADWTGAAILEREVQNMRAFYESRIIPLDKHREGGGWSEPTGEHFADVLSCLFGFFRSDFNEEFTIAPYALALAFLTFPILAQTYVAWRAGRLETAFDRDFITRADVDVFSFARWLTADPHGYIRQTPALADRLSEVFDRRGRPIVSAAQVAAAKADWTGACDAANRAYDEQVRKHLKLIQVSRDTHEDILPILQSSDPLAALRLGTRGLAAEKAALQNGSEAWRIVVKDQVVFGIEAQTGLRLATLFKMDLGHVFELDGKFFLKIPRRHFKNKCGPFFQIPQRLNRRKKVYKPYYERMLLDNDGLYDAIRQYRDEIRIHELGADTSQAFFLNSNTKDGRAYWAKRARHPKVDPARLSTRGLRRSFERVFERHIVWNPHTQTGFPGFHAVCGSHTIRHILATGVLKSSSGNVDLAADAIHDSPETIHAHYIRYLPEDREQALLDVLRQGLV